jgi:ADP-ribose pyrophosphatase
MSRRGDARPGTRATPRRIETTVVHRETRATARGTELRWMVTRETFEETGTAVVRGIVRHPGVCVVVALPAPGEILFVRQYRVAVRAELWELPAGTLEAVDRGGRIRPLEAPRDCAARELEEESGYRAGRIEKIGECYSMPGIGDEVLHVFLARDLRAGVPRPDDGERISGVDRIAVRAIPRMIVGGRIRDAKTLVALHYARLTIQRSDPA